jgi:hypothetical protein
VKKLLTWPLDAGHFVVRSPTAWALVTLVLVWFLDGVRTAVPAHVSGTQGGIYGTVAGVAATLLGFLLAGVALLAALPTDLPLISRAREEGRLKEAIKDLSRATVAASVTVAVALAGLLVDPEPERGVARDDLPAETLWVWLMLASLIPTTTWLVRSMKVTADAATSSADPARQ